MALMRGALLINPEEFQSNLGMSLLEYQRRVIFIAVASKQSKSSEERDIVKHCMLCSAILRFCTHVCNGLHQSREGSALLLPIQEVCQLLKHCTSNEFLPKAPASNITQCRSFVLFDAIRLMEAIGFGIPRGCPRAALDVS